MRRTLLISLLVALVLPGLAAAQDQTLILRFGPTLLEPTADGELELERAELGSQTGFEVNFEWMFHPRWGLEASNQISGDIDVDRDNDTVAGVSFTWFTVGLNVHPVRTERFDWGLGVMGGRSFYSDFEFDEDDGDIDSRDDTVWGAQTFLDISVNRRWAVNLGVRYLETALELKNGDTIDYDPLAFRVMGVVRW